MMRPYRTPHSQCCRKYPHGFLLPLLSDRYWAMDCCYRQPLCKSFPWLKWQRHATAAGRKIKFEESVSRSGYIGLRRQIADYLNVVRGESQC
ncbi:hypothetical protein [Aliamphritea spongicola]|nr:hypothetical protein [Aliamphritea spongicola]